jgi:hypothetical protein
MKNLRLPANVAFVGIVSTKLGVFNAMMAFVLTGAIPGTSIFIPASFVLLVTIAGLWLMLLRVILPFLIRRQTLQVIVPTRVPETIPVDTIIYTSGKPDFLLFSPVVHVSR